MLKSIVVFVLTAALLTNSATALAFGKLGHQLVCQLAYDQLTIQQQQQLNQLISSISTQDNMLLARFNDKKLFKKPVFSDTCNWADAIKSQTQYQSFNTWHYINIKRNQQSINRYSCNKNCITHAIAYHRQQAQHSKTDQKKLIAIMLLSHWIGDIHQPLHVSFASDWGGNKIKVSSPDNQCTNMHWLWDQCLLTRQIDSTDQQIIYNKLYQELTKQLALFAKKQQVATNEIDWANESLAITLRSDSQYCQMRNKQCQAIEQSPVKLADNYQQTFAPIINKRVIQAAMRLAHET